MKATRTAEHPQQTSHTRTHAHTHTHTPRIKIIPLYTHLNVTIKHFRLHIAVVSHQLSSIVLSVHLPKTDLNLLPEIIFTSCEYRLSVVRKLSTKLTIVISLHAD